MPFTIAPNDIRPNWLIPREQETDPADQDSQFGDEICIEEFRRAAFSESLARCSALARVLYLFMRETAGSTRIAIDNPNKIRASLLPYDVCDAELLIEELIRNRLVKRIKVGEYLFPTKWPHVDPDLEQKELWERRIADPNETILQIFFPGE